MKKNFVSRFVMRIHTKAKIASILGFFAIFLYANNKSDITAVGKYAGYAIIIATPVLMLIWKYQEKLNTIPKEINALLTVICFFLWRWLHSVSYAAEDILAFVVGFIFVFLSFFLDEKYFNSLLKK
jgi:hypothetical protein